MITIVNYGMGNIGSIINMFKRIGVKAEAVSDVKSIENATKILLPGVGAFDAAMSKINELGIKDVLNYKACEEKIPVLGICLGMQLLTQGSDEGVLPGLGWINARTHAFKKFVSTQDLKIPHMGWNEAIVQKKSPLVHGFEDFEDLRFYFVHSYFVKCENLEDSLLKTEHGLSFDSAVQHENIYGAQFHPEKSHRYGMKLFENFARV